VAATSTTLTFAPQTANAVTRKLEALAPLGPDDRLMARRMGAFAGDGLAPVNRLAAEGAVPDSISWLIEGWAAWQQGFPRRSAQILALLLPGDSWEGILRRGSARPRRAHLTRARIAKIPSRGRYRGTGAATSPGDGAAPPIWSNNPFCELGW